MKNGDLHHPAVRPRIVKIRVRHRIIIIIILLFLKLLILLLVLFIIYFLSLFYRYHFILLHSHLFPSSNLLFCVSITQTFSQTHCDRNHLCAVVEFELLISHSGCSSVWFVSAAELLQIVRSKMGAFKVTRVETSPIDGQKPGTSGLRKKVWFLIFAYFFPDCWWFSCNSFWLLILMEMMIRSDLYTYMCVCECESVRLCMRVCIWWYRRLARFSGISVFCLCEIV